MSAIPHGSRHPIVVVTGANGGVGLGICHRLITQLANPTPYDAHLKQPNKVSDSVFPFSPTKQLTLVLACRNAKRAQAARQRLLTWLDEEVLRQMGSKGYNGHAEEFRRGLSIDFVPLDLANLDSIFKFAEEAERRYPYITHLILNAGILSMTGFDWCKAIKQILTDPVAAITTPRYLIQPIGTESTDGLGFVFQCNVFGHYCLFRLLERLLRINPYRDSRIEWMSSLDALPDDYDSTDMQLRRAECPYQASKYQMDLLSTALTRAIPKKPTQENDARLTHILVHPGVCHTDMVASVVGQLLLMAKLFAFYLVRLIGSQNHPIKPYKGAVAAIHASLTPLHIVQDDAKDLPRKFGSKTTMFGEEYVDTDIVLDWDINTKHASDLMEYCDRLLSAVTRARAIPPSITTDSETGPI